MVIRIENLSKVYHLGEISRRMLFRDWRRRLAHAAAEDDPELFWALRDVSFDVQDGEVLGLLGRNGAGKSTLLKILSRITSPTRGVMKIKGRVAALLEVGTGFHFDLTGRDNIYLNGTILGMTRREVARKFDEIVAFSGVEEFIDTPVKRYSSGMNARLGFAIAGHLDPDVLLVDEVLSVGDVAFQEKCVARMRELLARGVPLVFVSHNLGAVVDLCTRAILIDHGVVQFNGRPAEAVAEFRRAGRRVESTSAHRGETPIRITDVQLLQADGDPSPLFQTGGPMTIRVRYRAAEPIRQPHVAIDVHSVDGVYCAGINTRMDTCALGTLDGSGLVDLVIPNLSLLPGCYTISAGILDPQGLGPLDLHDRAYPFSVVSERRDFGIVYLAHHWHHESARPGTATAAHRTVDRLRGGRLPAMVAVGDECA